MIKECILAKTGIQFDLEYLKESVDFDFNGLLEEMGEKGVKVEDLGIGYEGLRGYADEVPPSIVVESANGGSVQTCYARANGYPPDRCDNIFDQLILVWLWWLIEFIPTLFTYQDAGGNWVRLRLYVKLSRDFSKKSNIFARRNLGRGRYIPFHENEVRVHESVEKRMREVEYTPKAYNWKQIAPMIKYVK